MRSPKSSVLHLPVVAFIVVSTTAWTQAGFQLHRRAHRGGTARAWAWLGMTWALVTANATSSPIAGHGPMSGRNARTSRIAAADGALARTELAL